jgi:hypothetical protein
MIVQFNSEFERIAGLINGEYTNKNTSEFEDFAQNHNYKKPSINWVPILRVRSEVGASGQIIYKGECVIQFLTKFVKSDNYENTKDVLIDQMISLNEQFITQLNLNENLIFIQPRWTFDIKIVRQFTSNLLCGTEMTITFETSCARLGKI